MTSTPADRLRLQPLTRARVATLGEAGQRWHEALPGTLDRLAAVWSLTWGRALPGGSASYVVAARTATGERRVVKIPVPDAALADEARVLAAAGGRGYARLFGHDTESDAVLLEHLGGQLEHHLAEPLARLDVLADTLREAWTAAIGPGLDDEAGNAAATDDKAVSLFHMIRDLDARLDHAASPEVIRTALDHAEALAGWGGPTVVAHGDPHPANCLRAPDGRGSGWVFVDPDGFRADPAHDLGVTLRDWSSRLRRPEARATLRAWSRHVAQRADWPGVDAERVWAWAFVERVSTGLYVTSFGAPRVGAPFLETAAALL
ncbi:phosphotransferase [Nocardioides acrostichi]|uniref:Phosphotransferase n=1 Tax=Nocardioides acrostichi TaxID=2784339 RepID=A0A930V0L0_9ACTN|nr:phosphotransferase [Nocardioides acrostichi]MBF4161537.1 phosphotransferase [Nocardioides acrostichi]